MSEGAHAQVLTCSPELEQTAPPRGHRMDARRQLTEVLRVPTGARAGLDRRETTWTGDGELASLSRSELDKKAKKILEDGTNALADAQELLWASDSRAVLAVFQAMDAAGKDSTIKHVMSGVNPQGVKVVSFKQPSTEERDHPFLWRVWKAVPERGQIGIFNRSHYEEVLVVRVHPELLEGQRLPPGPRDEAFWAQRFEDINAFEQHLARNGTTIVKFFLHVSKEEQKRRFIRRLDHPEKLWKFSAGDVVERRHWDAYQSAYEEAITATSTDWAPWYVIPADHKPVMQAMVARVLVDVIIGLDLEWPTVSDDEREAGAAARRELEAEEE